jgi:hypothetical protein
VAYPSILGLFDDQVRSDDGVTVTDGLTPWDLSYLKALYSGPSNMTADLKIGQIRSRMQEELRRATISKRAEHP